MIAIHGRIYPFCKRVSAGPEFETGIKADVWIKRVRKDLGPSDEVRQPFFDIENFEPTTVSQEIEPTTSHSVTSSSPVRLELKSTSDDGHRHYIGVDRFGGHVIGIWQEVAVSDAATRERIGYKLISPKSRKGNKQMSKHFIGSREQWLEARLRLLNDEKELTRRSDDLARRRQALPWVKIDKNYQFDTDGGKATLVDLFGGRSQLLVYHFMFGPDYDAGCPSCSSISDGFNGFAVHLANRDVTLMAVSRAPIEKLQAYKKRMGWSFPWASSEDGEFNYDFNASLTEEQQRDGAEYNYRREPAWEISGISDSLTSGGEEPVAQAAATTGTDVATYTRERPGLSAFVIEDGVVYHTYSTYSRGLDALWGIYQWLDRAPKGRNDTDAWLRRHDEYNTSVG